MAAIGAEHLLLLKPAFLLLLFFLVERISLPCKLRGDFGGKKKEGGILLLILGGHCDNLNRGGCLEVEPRVNLDTR